MEKKSVWILLILELGSFIMSYAFSDEVVSITKVENKPDLKVTRCNDKECGPRSLLFICEILGVEANLDELCRLSGMNESGTTMYGLYQAARQKGLEAVGMQMGIDELMQIESLGIAFVRGNHFLVVEKCIDDEIRVIDSPNVCHIMTKEEFAKIWSGKILLISRQAESKAKNTQSPNIIFVEYNYDFGEIEQGAIVNHVYGFINAGNEKLVIKDIQSSCGCAAVLLSNKNISPDGQGEIEVDLDTRGLRGRITKTITVNSNDPNDPIVLLTITGRVKQNLAYFPQQILFGTVRKGTTPTRQITIIAPSDRKIRIKEVTSSSPYLVCGAPGFMDVSTSEQLKGGLVASEQPERYQIDVALSPEVPLGEIKGLVTLKFDNPKNLTFQIPVSGTIVGPITINPDRFFFGIVKNGDATDREISLSAEEEFRVLEIRVPEESLKVIITEITPRRHYRLSAKLVTKRRGKVHGNVTLQTDNADQPVVTIPFYGLILKEVS